jgi:hypothetical protein
MGLDRFGLFICYVAGYHMALGDAYLAFCLRDPYVVNTFLRLLEWRGSKVVMPGTANPLFAGSIPARASIPSNTDNHSV